jgi:hypothetical protein
MAKDYQDGPVSGKYMFMKMKRDHAQTVYAS